MAEGAGPRPGVAFERLGTASSQVFGRATLDVPATLNALTLEMIDALDAQLRSWASDPGVGGVIIDADSEKAFCAGGDVVALYRSMRSADGQVPLAASSFFENEYRLDHRIHTYPKPVLCWGHGIVMGGGVGLFAGASHRVVTARTRFAMPEITIGLYPEVGGSWILSRLRARVGLFLALTAAPLNAADLREAGLADYALRHEDREAAYRSIAETRWSGEADVDHARLSHLLDGLPAPADLAPSNLRTHGGLIDRVMGNDTLADIAGRLPALVEQADPWLAAAGRAFVAGSPTSAALCVEMQRRAKHLSLADAFRLEYQASVGCAMGHDFPEGVRALLVDKDRSPRWSPADLASVRAADVDAIIQPRFVGEHPLADLR